MVCYWVAGTDFSCGLGEMAVFKSVTSVDNPVIRRYMALLGSKKEREAARAFPLEGLRLCADALSGRGAYRLVTLLVTRWALMKYGQQLEVFTALEGCDCIEIGDKIGDKLSDTKQTQGIFGICERVEGLDKSDFGNTIEKGGLYLVLSGLQDPGNLGTLLRTAEALGVSGVFLRGCCDMFAPKVIRASMGALLRIRVEQVDFSGLERVKSAMGSLDMKLWAAVVEGAAKAVGEVDWSGGGGVMVGNEGNGLSQEEIGFCHDRLTIPIGPSANSLNAAMAGVILVWEMTKGRGSI